jgi:hypothetical protein
MHELHKVLGTAVINNNFESFTWGRQRPLPVDFGVLGFLSTWPPARPRDVYMQVGAGQGGGHTGCTRLAPTMQAGQD